ncbi:RlpA-like double-psi beta-barrel-protein domain-containing protein-containing protein [Umbelopsis sp. PMI_123]|nr:RlpA-like double-psi beta-barrel-protein domain-containing protein-containing protein [Umbelopsis sp. PMI_123]
MKPITFIIACVALFIACLSPVQALEGHGIARLMGPEYTNSTTSLEKRGRGTWYSGNDLKNAACYDRNGLPPYSASIHSMIGAMAMHSFESCYKCMKITNRSNKKSVVVKIVDKCAGCVVGKAIDLTPGAFQKIGNLNTGVLDISWKTVKCGKSKYYPSKPAN